jgi:hypothetical protein
MPAFSQSIRRLKEGLDLQAFAFYCGAFIKLWWEVFWGPTLLGIPFGLYTLYYAPARKWFIAYVLIVALLTGYYLWREYYVRLQPAFAIARILPQTWIDPGTGKHAMAYYFEVINKSETTSILEAEAQLSEIVPIVENLEWLPVHLSHKHDRSDPREKTFSLHPGQPKLIDLVSAFEKGNQFTVLHVVSGVNSQVVGRERRRLKVTITGKDVPALSKWFDVYFDSDGFFVCEMK